jgi:phosphoglycolate phosphatase
MDGTVVDSGKMLVKTVNSVRGHFDLPPMPPRQMLQALNDPDINSARYFYGTETFNAEQTRLFESYYHDFCTQEIELYAGIKELLEDLHGSVDFALATNAHTAFAKKILNHVRIDGYFSHVVGADMVAKPKPHPDMILHTLDRFSYPKEKAILIGDSQKDKRAAQAANISHALVSWGFSEHPNEESLINDAQSLRELIERFCTDS